MNMSNSTENMQTPIIKEFNLLPVSSPITISDLENTHMNMSSSTENIPTPVVQEFNKAPVPSPSTISDSVNPKNLDKYPENCQTPGSEDILTEPATSPTPPKQGNNTCSLPQASAPPGWKHTSPQPSPLEEYSENIEDVDISPNSSHPPGGDDIVAGSAPPTPAKPGSSSIDKYMDSSPEISQPPGWENFGLQHIPAPLPGINQMVCGSCRRLLSYLQGSTRVKCPCCQTINFVLEEHQVGTVKCAKCWVWLIYPHGAPSVRCSACHFVTQIGEDNARPPLSVQQKRSFVSPSPLQ